MRDNSTRPCEKLKYQLLISCELALEAQYIHAESPFALSNPSKFPIQNYTKWIMKNMGK